METPTAGLPESLGALFFETARRLPAKKALSFKKNGRYESISYAEMERKVAGVVSSFTSLGLRAGDRVAILSENRPEWAITDIAAQVAGLVTVPIYPSLTPEEIRYILSDSGARLIAVSTKEQFAKIAFIYKGLPLAGVLAFNVSVSVAQKDVSLPVHFMKDFEVAAPRPQSTPPVDHDSLASIIYTSGTTGVPKGVMLTHGNFIHNVARCQTALKMGETDIHLSFLPLCHVFERMAGHYLMLRIGATIAYAESLDTVSANLLEARPTFILGVPRFYEKIRDRVLDTVNHASPARKGLFFWGKALGRLFYGGKPAGKPSFWEKIQFRLASVLVFHKFAKRLGGRVRFCVSGGAPLPREIAEFFRDLGVFIYEGYGLTETSPVIAVNREGRYKFGTVGIPLEGITVKIMEDGEIATGGPCVMKGYFNKPEETAASLKDGLFFTGDLGAIDKDGFLAITGRKKELIVTSGGKKIAPRAIEEMVENDAYFQRCVLYGEGRKFLTALIVPRRDKIEAYAHENKIEGPTYEELLKSRPVQDYLAARIDAMSQHLANYEKIKYFHLLPEDFTQAAGELTPTLKVKREVVLKRHADRLDPFYLEGGRET